MAPPRHAPTTIRPTSSAWLTIPHLAWVAAPFRPCGGLRGRGRPGLYDESVTNQARTSDGGPRCRRWLVSWASSRMTRSPHTIRPPDGDFRARTPRGVGKGTPECCYFVIELT